ncbi:hypothetical protein EV356DRAFT_506774 [Viridothelium virens]|uniref:Uncharacterized protein n=1 Tax=Viridothelium virens TaxID=1048519 RepID=A0A6A6H0Q8_VIRVR|nr:hypothetical protein EV356DRAFT_506774 [Viridothelium virens]
MIVKLEQGDDHLTFMEKRKDQEEKLLRSLSIGSQCQEKLGLRSSFSRAAKAVFAGFVHTLATTGVVGIKSFLHRGNRNSASKGQRDRT